MGCGCGNNTNTGFVPAVTITPAQNCMIDQAMLSNWLDKLTCVKQSNMEAAIGLDTTAINRLIGVVQSAINWASNYCYFEYQLQEVLLLMPRIIALNICNAN